MVNINVINMASIFINVINMVSISKELVSSSGLNASHPKYLHPPHHHHHHHHPGHQMGLRLASPKQQGVKGGGRSLLVYRYIHIQYIQFIV